MRVPSLEYTVAISSPMIPPDHQHALGDRFQLQRASRIDDARILRQKRQFHGLAAGGDDGLGELDRFLAARRDDFEMMRVDEGADAV
jgi:hypothetical protein